MTKSCKPAEASIVTSSYANLASKEAAEVRGITSLYAACL